MGVCVVLHVEWVVWVVTGRGDHRKRGLMRVGPLRPSWHMSLLSIYRWAFFFYLTCPLPSLCAVRCAPLFLGWRVTPLTPTVMTYPQYIIPVSLQDNTLYLVASYASHTPWWADSILPPPPSPGQIRIGTNTGLFMRVLTRASLATLLKSVSKNFPRKKALPKTITTVPLSEI